MPLSVRRPAPAVDGERKASEHQNLNRHDLQIVAPEVRQPVPPRHRRDERHGRHVVLGAEGPQHHDAQRRGRVASEPVEQRVRRVRERAGEDERPTAGARAPARPRQSVIAPTLCVYVACVPNRKSMSGRQARAANSRALCRANAGPAIDAPTTYPASACPTGLGMTADAIRRLRRASSRRRVRDGLRRGVR